MLEVCASKIGDIILSVLESKMENKLDEVKKAKIISDTRKSIKVAICLLYNSKCIDLRYDEKRVLPTTEQEMGKNG